MTTELPGAVPPLAAPGTGPAAGPSPGPTPAAGGPAALAVRGRMTARSGDSAHPPAPSAAGPRLPAGAVLVEDAAPAGGILDTVLQALDTAAEVSWERGRADCQRCETVPCDDHRADIQRGIRYASLATRLRKAAGHD
jgi:hypothetical protein